MFSFLVLGRVSEETGKTELFNPSRWKGAYFMGMDLETLLNPCLQPVLCCGYSPYLGRLCWFGRCFIVGCDPSLAVPNIGWG